MYIYNFCYFYHIFNVERFLRQAIKYYDVSRLVIKVIQF